MKQRFLAAFDGIDALLTPTTQTPAVRVESVDQTTTPAHFTRLVNLLELCALAVPDGFTATGLPLSLQIVCRPMTRQRRCASAGPISRRPSGTSATRWTCRAEELK